MSILIKMEMPKNCEDCFFLGTDSNAHWYCYCQQKKISITSEKAYDSGCPLIEVPKHGDLIDRDALNIDISKSVVFTVAKNRPSAEMRGAFKVLDRLEIAPTIIESEE